jgi:ABC-type multidrug transport system fused ATPase/permease subunit
MLGGFGILLLRMLPLMNHLYAVLGNLGYASGGMREIFVWLDLPRFPARPFGSKPFNGIQHSIRIENLSFHYPNGTPALKELNLEIPAGKTVALVGSSGSGKSTLASLLLRLREPTSGRIVVDGTDYWEFDPAAWHARLGMVEQEAFLFNETIEHNITFGSAGATPAQVQKALRVAHLEEVVATLPNGLQTMVGERGTMLSGGQKQRLAIARAMVREPLLLILDEATSALDNVSERQVQAALDDARRGRTSVVIAHRLSTIRNADLIVVLAGGRIVETGTWADLESRDGHFKELLAAAQGGHLAEAG